MAAKRLIKPLEIEIFHPVQPSPAILRWQERTLDARVRKWHFIGLAGGSHSIKVCKAQLWVASHLWYLA